MTERSNAVLAIGKRRIFETIVHPGYYAAVTLALLVAIAAVDGFVGAVDSSGFDYRANLFYSVIGSLLSQWFGTAAPARLFADGPFLFAANLSFVPVLLYLSMTSVYRFGTEKSAFALELLSYGPSDGTAYFLASVLKDVIMTVATLVVFLAFFLLAGVLDNLYIGPRMFDSLMLLLFVSPAVYAWGALISVSTDSASSALALFFGGFVFFLLTLVGSHAIMSGYAHTLSAAAAWIVQWVSPFYYWSIALQAALTGDVFRFFLGTLGLLALTAGLLLASHFVIRGRGVRP